MAERTEPELISKPGIYPMITASEYHADPVEDPSLSAGIAICLVHQTPFQAWLKHPRLGEEMKAEAGEELEEKTSKVSRVGSACHELLLDRGAGVYTLKSVYPADHKLAGLPVVDYKTAAAKAELAAAEAAGYIGVLQHEYDKALELVDIIKSQTQAVPGMEKAFEKGHGMGEVVCIAQEPDQGPWLRCMIDWWQRDGNIIDLKTTGQDLSDDTLARKIDNENLDMRAAFYLRTVARVRPDLAGKIRYRFVFVQQKAPYELRVVELDSATINSGHKKVAFAIAKWRYCLEHNYWPGYPRRIETMSMPKWAAAKWEDRETFDAPVIQAIMHDPYVSSITTPHIEKQLEIAP
jgi:hypothetical protein